MGDALSALEALYFGLQQQVGMLTLAATTQAQKDAFMTQYVKARTDYWACVNKMFHEDDPQVAALTAQLNTLNDQVTKSEKEMGDISKVIDVITQAVTVADQLVPFAAGL
jgi:esterase/lipase